MNTYVISDIHGEYKKFKSFKSKLNSDDKVYVLGDVIDRGKDGLKMLLEIMEDKRFTMLLGNHEYMMWYVLKTEKLTNRKIKLTHIWNNVGGKETLKKYFKLPESKRSEILSFIEKCPLVIPNVIVNDKHYFLVHAYPFKDIDNPIYIKDALDGEIDIWLSERMIYPYPATNLIENKVVIIGHTPVQHLTDDSKPIWQGKNKGIPVEESNLINIDTGCGGHHKNSVLTSFCLNSETFEYY